MRELETKIGYHFKRPELLQRALTHSSYGYERDCPHNERLEFLGDAVLGYLVAYKLFDTHQESREGVLSKQRSAIVSARTLSKKARQLGIGSMLRLGTGERRSQGALKDSILADAMEGIIAAVMLDGGIDAASRLIDVLFDDEIRTDSLALKREQDFKTELQERLQGLGLGLPEYVLMEEEGPPHDRRYYMSVVVLDQVRALGWGTSKKAAQQECAKVLLEDAAFWDDIAHPNTGKEE